MTKQAISVGTRVYYRGHESHPFGRFHGRKGTVVSLVGDQAQVQWDETPNAEAQLFECTPTELEAAAPVTAAEDYVQLYQTGDASRFMVVTALANAAKYIPPDALAKLLDSFSKAAYLHGAR